MDASGLFLCDDPRLQARMGSLVARLPALRGEPIRVHRVRGLRDRTGPVHAGAFLRERRIAFDCTRAEFARIFVHEIAHFIWLRLGNPRRLSYESILRTEIGTGRRGELGWSAERRKQSLTPRDIRRRTRRWREYCCESFCDTAARLYCGMSAHPEFTLPANLHARRARWFKQAIGCGPLSI